MKSWSDQKRIEVVTAHVMGLKAPMIEAATGVPKQTIRHWRQEDWFKDLVQELQREDDSEVDAKLTKIVGKSLDHVVDRLENGDFMYDPKAGSFVRRPMYAKDVVKVADIMYDKRNLLRGKPTNISAKAEQISDRLIKLAAEFSRFVNAKDVTPNGNVESTQRSIEGINPGIISSPGQEGRTSYSKSPEGGDQAIPSEEVTYALHDERAPGLQEGKPALQL